MSGYETEKGAADMLEASYLWLLRISHGQVRVRMQNVMATIRDEVAYRRGETAEVVQNRCEERVRREGYWRPHDDRNLPLRFQIAQDGVTLRPLHAPPPTPSMTMTPAPGFKFRLDHHGTVHHEPVTVDEIAGAGGLK